MTNRLTRIFRFLSAAGVLAAVGISGQAHAQTLPRVALQNSQSFLLDSYVRAFRVPVTGTDGKNKYYDVTIQLTLDTTGRPNGATVTTVDSISTGSGAVLPGTYKSGGTTCVVSNVTLTNGRIQSFFKCTGQGINFNASVATGSVSAGHPYLNELVGKIDKRSDVATFTWGFTIYGSSNFDGCGLGPGNSPGPIGMKVAGSQIFVSVFNSVGSFLCGATLAK